MAKTRDISVRDVIGKIDSKYAISLHSMTEAELEELEVAIKYVRRKMPLENLEMTPERDD